MTLFQEYKNSLKKIDVEEILDLVFYRPLAFLFVKAVYRTRITPNQITVLSLIFGLMAAVGYSFGTHAAYLIGSALCLLYNVLDCSDGQLARLKKNGTAAGRILDGASDYIVTMALYFGIGFGFASRSPHPWRMWLLAWAAGFSNAIQSGLLDYYRTRYLDHVIHPVSILGEGLKEVEEAYERLKMAKGRHFEKVIIGGYLKYSALQRGINRPAAGSVGAAVTIPAEEYTGKNRRIMRLWTFLGPTTQLTFLMAMSIIDRLDIYLIGIFAGGNLIAILLYALQHRVDIALQLKTRR